MGCRRIGTGLVGLAATVALWLLCAPAGASVTAAGVPHVQPAAASVAHAERPAGAQLRTIAGDAPARAPKGARRVRGSAAPAGRPLTITLVLKRAHQTGFQTYLRNVYRRGSSIYRRFQSQAQLTARYGPSARTYTALRSWLSAHGLRAVARSANRLTLTVRGTRLQAERAFHTSIVSYRLPAHGPVIYANTRAPALPATLAGHVQAVTGLSDLTRPTRPAPHYVKVSNQCRNGVCTVTVIACVNGNCFSQTQTISLQEKYGNCLDVVKNAVKYLFATKALPAALAATMLNAIACNVPWEQVGNGSSCFNFGKAPSGIARCPNVRRRSSRAVAHVQTSTVKIGLLEFDTFTRTDVSDWLSLLGVDGAGQLSRLSQQPVAGGVSAPGAGESEVLLDADTVLWDTLPTGAPVVVYDAPPTASFAEVFNAMIGDGDTVISNSWSQCEDDTPVAEAQAIDSVLAQASAGGISVLNSAGDTGSTCLDGSPNTVGVPADSPNATAVGGSTAIPGAGGSYGSESWWNGTGDDPPTGQGGFGTSKDFALPGYQNGHSSAAGRSVPDVVAPANPVLGPQICQADSGGCPDGQQWGGSSIAAPEWASIVADLESQLGLDLGNVNAAVYPVGATAAFHSAAGMGSDFAHVGLGDANYAQLLGQLAGYTPRAADAAASQVIAESGTGSGEADVPADGTAVGTVVVQLRDANGFPVSGKSVSVTSDSAHATISAPSGTSDDTGGTVSFTVTDATAETVTFTATDSSDGVALSTHPTLTFIPPVATGAQISGGPATVTDDGTHAATITVYLQDSRGRPAAGKTVTLSQGGGHAVITPGSTAVTDAAGNASFSATDTSAESVNFAASDTSDGALPVPGSVLVNYTNGTATCGTALPTAGNGFGVSAFATGFPYTSEAVVYPNNFTVGACTAIESAPAFDVSGNAYIADSASGTINVLGPSGGAASAANQLPDANFPGGSLGQLAFTKDGSLFAGLSQSGGSYQNPEVVQLDPVTGATIRVIADKTGGLPDCPSVLAPDPLSGDLITDDNCNGAATNNQISRIHDPSGAHPTVSNYLTTSGCNVGLTFAPDGTLYLARCTPTEIDQIGATNTSNPTTTRVAGLSSTPASVAVTGVNGSGQATQLEAFSFDGSVSAIDLTQSPATVTTAASGSSPFFLSALGVGSCGYSSIPGTVVQVAPASGQCSGAGPAAGPAITLTQTGSTSPATGTSTGFTTTLSGVSGAAGTPVQFAVSGSNGQVALVHADGSGAAPWSYSGAFPGVDTVTATAVVNSVTITSAPLQVHWTAGLDTSVLSLNASRHGGPLGQAAQLSATLLDVVSSPAAPIAGAPVTLSVGSASCATTTDGSGLAACSVTPPGGVGLQAMAGSYAGDASHTAASASDVFLLGAVGLGAPSAPPPPPPPVSGGVPVNTAPPVLAGTPTPGNRLSCSQGSWSGSPTAFAYRWERAGKVIAGATSARYVVQIVDEALRLSCAVTASNARGAGAAAHSASVLVAIKGTTGCTKPSGRLKGATIGRLTLGLSRTAARGKLRRFGVTHNDFDNFCLYGGWGIRAGYPSAKLVRSLPAKQRTRVTGVVLLSTANPFYALDGVKPGSNLTKQVRRRLHLGKAFRIGKNDWYIVSGAKADGVLKVRGSVIQEVGVADKGLLGARAAQRRFLTSFSNT